MTTKTNKIAITKPVQAIVEKVESKYIIDSPQAMMLASDWRVKLKGELKTITEHKERKTKPMNEALKAVRADYKPFETQIESALAILDKAMSTYQTAETKRVQEEEAKIAVRVGAGKGKLSADTASDRIAEIDKPDTRVVTTAGATSFRPHQQLKIIDMNMITAYVIKTGDFSFFDLDEATLKSVLLSGKVVPGAEIETIQIPVNR